MESSYKTHLLSELFYHDCASRKNAGLKKGLEEYEFLLLISISAAKNLKNGELEKFDALVGENACQIRAIKIALIASEDLSYLEDLLERLHASFIITEKLLAENSIQSLMHSDVSLKEVIDLYGLDIQLNEDEMFFIQSHVLSEMKECLSDKGSIISLCKEERSNPNKLRFVTPKVSSSFLKYLAGKIKNLLSESSVSFVTKTAKNLKDPLLLQRLLEGVKYYNTRACTPMFWTYKTLLSLARKENIPIILHAKFLNEIDNSLQIMEERFLYFKNCPDKQEYIQMNPTEEDLMMPACIVEGVVYSQDQSLQARQEWVNFLNDYSVFDIILAGAAHHRQYPSQELSLHIPDIEFENYKKMASENGFSLDNPKTFFIRHVYPAQVGKKLFAS